MAEFDVMVTAKPDWVKQYEVKAEKEGDARHAAVDLAKEENLELHQGKLSNFEAKVIDKKPGFEGDF